MQIRPLGSEEVDRVTAVLGVSRLYQGDGFYLVAWDGAEPLGHVHLALTDPPELQDVLVREGFRGRGVASALTEAAENEARARGFSRFRVMVSIDNPAGQALYRGLGFVECGIEPERVTGTIELRTGPLDVDDTLLTWEKPL